MRNGFFLLLCFFLGIFISIVCIERIFLVLFIIGSRVVLEVFILSFFRGVGVEGFVVVGEG